MKLDEIPANWLPPDGLGYSSLRPVRLSAGGYLLAVVAASLVLGGLALSVVVRHASDQETARRERLERQGVIVNATIERLWRESGKDHNLYVRYEFAVDGEFRVGSTKAPARIWRALRVGGELPVRYLPDSPEINFPAAWRMSVTPAWLAILPPAVFLGIFGMLAVVLRRQWLLLSEGRPAPGVVVKARQRDKQVVLNYEFRLLNGAVQRGRSSTNSRSVPGEGSVVCVIYNPDNPRHNGVYPFPLVRVDKR